MITPEQCIYVVVGLLAVIWLHRTFGQPKPTPMTTTPPIVSARVIDSHQGVPAPLLDPLVQLALQMDQMIAAKGTALAFDRKMTELTEAKAKVVEIPWAVASAPPKA